MRKLITIVTVSVLVYSFLVGTAVAAPRLAQSMNGNSNGSLSFVAIGDTSCTFENVGESHTFYMRITNTYNIDATVYLSTFIGGIEGYFWCTVPSGSHTVPGNGGSVTLFLWVKARGQSPDTDVPVTFTVTASSGSWSQTLTPFSATILSGDGGPPKESSRDNPFFKR